MIIVHDIFICKPGNASKLAKIFKEYGDEKFAWQISQQIIGLRQKSPPLAATAVGGVPQDAVTGSRQNAGQIPMHKILMFEVWNLVFIFLFVILVL